MESEKQKGRGKHGGGKSRRDDLAPRGKSRANEECAVVEKRENFELGGEKEEVHGRKEKGCAEKEEWRERRRRKRRKKRVTKREESRGVP